MAKIDFRKYTFYGLNAVRALSIISLLLVFASSIYFMANNIKAVNAFEASKQAGAGASNISADDTNPDVISATDLMDCDYIEGSSVPNQPAGVFWAVVSSLLIIFQVIILIFSEVSWPIKFFDRFFPVLGSNFGLGALGIFQCLISTQILSHFVDDFTLVSAFFLFALGCLNMLLGLIYRESAKSKRSIRAWRADAHDGAGLPTTNPFGSENKSSYPVFVNASPQPTFMPSADPFADDKARSPSPASSRAVGMGFGRQGEKAAGLRGFILQPPPESLPRYAPPPPPSQVPSYTSSPRSRGASPVRNHGGRPASAARTSTSSFASPSQPVSPLALEYADADDDKESVRRGRRASDDRAETPVFRSSPTAL
ncbi:hypothetical protein HGRIS_012675 [Hohenbuehelia grisea]|uniref:DUF7598 domain-containing protein n=1 Tax=Hohenbuehelia grisea TaxID=104357 RepID=A0ABR3IT32_9AGAR